MKPDRRQGNTPKWGPYVDEVGQPARRTCRSCGGPRRMYSRNGKLPNTLRLCSECDAAPLATLLRT